ncbi:uncharacterized protein LOC118764908 [Octopus sinensis]|uniref:Uncharacterized protein LOC118764908 n=1 Tax=Octopus sinensis TaxID=2607531 RepID=A0A7E6F3Y0_9MOLL|nr:uncharacterized protein LOC118764908 [Octopus sinensis]
MLNVSKAEKKDSLWFPTTLNEIKAYFAINIIMGIRNLPRITNYWSSDKPFGDEYVSSIMTRTRFLKLTQYLHVRDTSSTPVRGEPGFDPLFKIRPLIDCVQNTKLYKPERCLSIDEGMVGYKGRVRFRQHIPGKPTKWGIKVWKICELNTGYCSGFEFYTGKRDTDESSNMHNSSIVKFCCIPN